MAGDDAEARSGRALCAELRSLRLIPRLQMTYSGGVIYAFKVQLFPCPRQHLEEELVVDQNKRQKNPI